MRNKSMYQADFTLTSLDAAYVTTTSVTCTISMIGASCIIGVFMLYPDVRTTVRKLLVCLSFANIVQCAAGIMQARMYQETVNFPDERQFSCQSAASVLVIGQIASALWTCAIAVYIFLAVSLRAFVLAKKLLFVFYVFCFGMPVVVAAVAGLSGVYGYDLMDILYFHHPACCWLSDRVGNKLGWAFLTVEGWVIATYFLSFLLFALISLTVCTESSRPKTLVGRSHEDLEKEENSLEVMISQKSVRQLRFLPLCYCCLRVWGTAHFLFTEYPIKRHLRAFDWLLIIRAFGDNAQGLVNFVLFCITTTRIRRMMERIVSHYCLCYISWFQKQRRRVWEEKWMPQPIVRLRRNLTKIKARQRSDGNDIDISDISLAWPTDTAETDTELKYKDKEDEVLFER